jgi:hypothetical protein
MANQIAAVNGIEIANIANINGITDDNLAKWNGREFTGFVPTEAHTLIATATASSSATLSFTSGIDSTYDVYEFHFVRIHPSVDNIRFRFQVNASGETGFNEVITSGGFSAYHQEDAGATNFGSNPDFQQQQGTAYQSMTLGTGNATDESASGVLTLYAPSSTTYVKHFVSKSSEYLGAGVGYAVDAHTSGYINTTTAIDEISFNFEVGNIDSGQIKMYGIAKA